MRRFRLFTFIKDGFLGVCRNGLMSIASILVLFSSLFVIGVFVTLIRNVNFNLQKMEDFNNLVVYMNLDADENTVRDAEGLIRAVPGVDSVKHVDKDTALKKQKEMYGDSYSLIFDAYALFDEENEKNTADEKETSDTPVQDDLDIDQYDEDDPRAAMSEEQDEHADETVNSTEENAETQENAAEGEVAEEATEETEETEDAGSAEVDETGTQETTETQETESASGEEAEEEITVREVYNFGSRENPLPDAFEVKYSKVDDLDTIEANIKKIPGIDSIRNSREIAQNIEQFKKIITIGGAWLMALLALISVFVISNTIKLTYHSRELEISIMRYIGATKFYITMPFIVESVIISAIAAGLGYLVQWNIYRVLVEALKQYKIISVIPFAQMNDWFLVIYFGIGLFIGVFGSAFAIRKYMKV